MFKKKNNHRFFSGIKMKFIFVFGAVVILIFIISVVRETYRNYKISREIENLKQEINSLKNDNLELSSLLDYLKTDSFLEKEARIKLGMKKQGEKTVVVEKQSKSEKKLELSFVSIDDERLSNVRKWWIYFLGI